MQYAGGDLTRKKCVVGMIVREMWNVREDERLVMKHEEEKKSFKGEGSGQRGSITNVKCYKCECMHTLAIVFLQGRWGEGRKQNDKQSSSSIMADTGMMISTSVSLPSRPQWRPL